MYSKNEALTSKYDVYMKKYAQTAETISHMYYTYIWVRSVEHIEISKLHALGHK